MNASTRRTIFARLARANPEPKTELEYGSTFELLVAVALSAQAMDVSVNKATRKLFKIANTPTAMLELGEKKLNRHIRNIGLYNTKARNIIAACRILVNEHKSEVPSSRAELEKLPGVGRKTANVILNTAFGKAVIAVDTHIFRVSRRIGLASGKVPREVEEQLSRRVPAKYIKNAHHWLILHGRYVCVARRPRCPQCLINDLCDYSSKTEPLQDAN